MAQLGLWGRVAGDRRSPLRTEARMVAMARYMRGVAGSPSLLGKGLGVRANTQFPTLPSSSGCTVGGFLLQL